MGQPCQSRCHRPCTVEYPGLVATTDRTDMTTSFVDDQFTVRSGSDEAPLLLLLHGYGSNEQDLPSLLPHLPAGFASAAVRAPLTLAPGSYAWVPIGTPGRPNEDATAEATQALL